MHQLTIVIAVLASIVANDCVASGECDAAPSATKKTVRVEMINLGVPSDDRAIVAVEQGDFRIEAHRDTFVRLLQGSNTEPRLILRDRNVHHLYRWINEQPPGDDVRLERYPSYDDSKILGLIEKLLERGDAFVMDKPVNSYLHHLQIEWFGCAASGMPQSGGRQLVTIDARTIFRSNYWWVY